MLGREPSNSAALNSMPKLLTDCAIITLLIRSIKCYNPNTIKGIIEGRIRTEKYLEKKNGGKTNKWDIRTA